MLFYSHVSIRPIVGNIEFCYNFFFSSQVKWLRKSKIRCVVALWKSVYSMCTISFRKGGFVSLFLNSHGIRWELRRGLINWIIELVCVGFFFSINRLLIQKLLQLFEVISYRLSKKFENRLFFNKLSNEWGRNISHVIESSKRFTSEHKLRF